MKVTIYSVVTAILWGSIMTWIMYQMRKRGKVSGRQGAVCVTAVYLLCGVRILFPIDFSFTYGIEIIGWISKVDYFLFYRSILGDGRELTILQIFAGIWILGILWHTAWLARDYRRMWQGIRMLEKKEYIQAEEALRGIIPHKRTLDISVYQSSQVSIPLGIGLWNRMILLPDREYQERELHYILLHEYTHFVNRDLLMKMGASLLSCVFWWYPVARFLKREFAQALEIKCDLSVTESLSRQESYEYLNTIITSLKAANDMPDSFSGSGIYLLGNSESELKERFRIVLESKGHAPGRAWKPAGIACAFLLAFAVSYTFLPIVLGDGPPLEEIEDCEGAVDMSPENSYVLHQNGMYIWIRPEKVYQEIDKEFAFELREEGFRVEEMGR